MVERRTIQVSPEVFRMYLSLLTAHQSVHRQMLKVKGRGEAMYLKGKVHLRLVGEDGEVKQEIRNNNLIVTAGLVQLAEIIALGTGLFTHVACGTNTTAVDSSQVALGAQTARVAMSDVTPTGATVLYEANFPGGTGTGTVEELGIFNASSGGDMLARVLTGTITKGASDTLFVSWTISLSVA